MNKTLCEYLIHQFRSWCHFWALRLKLAFGFKNMPYVFTGCNIVVLKMHRVYLFLFFRIVNSVVFCMVKRLKKMNPQAYLPWLIENVLSRFKEQRVSAFEKKMKMLTTQCLNTTGLYNYFYVFSSCYVYYAYLLNLHYGCAFLQAVFVSHYLNSNTMVTFYF